jgi:uncharacterized protein YprB with RNaseH-like and TPR domain
LAILEVNTDHKIQEMIQSTFILLQGVGDYTERKLWSSGVSDWQSFLQVSSVPGIGRQRKLLHDEDLRLAECRFAARDARYFSGRLKSRDHWRLFETFRTRAVYLDIETTGEPAAYGNVTVVGLYGNGRMTSLVRNDTLTEDRLRDELAQYDVIVTFFGSVFDLPYLRAKFPRLALNHAHIDLCFAARRLGYRGGLKHLEVEFDIPRARDLLGLTGWDAVRLWQAGRLNGTSLDLLLRYNEADCRNLERLADALCTRLTRACRTHAPCGPEPE